ncbi:MAG: hypothetical protein ACRDCK_06370, partial [Plesiomonas shigelloides]
CLDYSLTQVSGVELSGGLSNFTSTATTSWPPLHMQAIAVHKICHHDNDNMVNVVRPNYIHPKHIHVQTELSRTITSLFSAVLIYLN